MQTKIITRFLALASIAAVSVMGTGCAMDAAEPSGENVTATTMRFDEFLQVVYQEPDTGIYIVNGDEPITSTEELLAFYEEVVLDNGGLIVHQANGTDAKWSDTQKLNLTYCVSTGFGAYYDDVVAAMASATGAWESAANIKYVHVASEDGSCSSTNKNVVFDVNPVNAGGRYLARAFFPNQSRSSRNVLIDKSGLTSTSPSLTGILRHELGHTLGFRHEHTRPEAGVCFEDDNWRALTPYDSSSVMHYPQCNGSNSWALNLTSLDKSGAATLYGSAGGGGGGGGKGGGKK